MSVAKGELMKKYKVLITKGSMEEKPSNDVFQENIEEYGDLNNLCEALPLETLMKRLVNGCCFNPGDWEGAEKRRDEFLDSKQIVCLDFDGFLKINDFMKICNEKSFYPNFFHTTSSHMLDGETHKFRAVFALDKGLKKADFMYNAKIIGEAYGGFEKWKMDKETGKKIVTKEGIDPASYKYNQIMYGACVPDVSKVVYKYFHGDEFVTVPIPEKITKQMELNTKKREEVIEKIKSEDKKVDIEQYYLLKEFVKGNGLYFGDAGSGTYDNYLRVAYIYKAFNNFDRFLDILESTYNRDKRSFKSVENKSVYLNKDFLNWYKSVANDKELHELADYKLEEDQRTDYVKDVQEEIFSIIKAEILETHYINSFNYERQYEKRLFEFDIFEEAYQDLMKHHIKLLKRYKTLMRHNKLDKKTENNKAFTVTGDLVKNFKKDTREIDGTKVMCFKGYELNFAAQKGACIISAGSHMGKSYFSIYSTVMTGVNVLYYAPDQDKSGIMNYCKTLQETTNIDFSKNNLKVKTDIPLGAEAITKDIDDNDSKIIVFDMFYNIKVADIDKLNEYELVNKQLEVIAELKEEHPNKMFILVHSTAKGKANEELNIENAVKGNNSIGHVVDYAWCFGVDSDGFKYIKCVKDRYPLGESRVGLKTSPFKDITTLLGLVHAKGYKL